MSASIAKGANLAKSAKLLQRVWRGVLGKKRARSKKRLDIAAEIAMQAVDPNVLFASDVKELAKKIQLAIVEPASHTFPPDEVLHLIRLSVMVLQSAKGLLGVTDYSDMNLRFYNEVDGRGLTWQQASMMTMRSERFIRLLRGVAFGSSTRPPRLIQIPSDCNLIYAAQSMNPAWCENTFLTMGAGSKICIQLFRWLNSIIEVAQRQAEFANFITSSFPDWLPKLQGYQRQARQVEMEIIIDDKAHSYLGDVLENNSADPVYVAELQREMSKLKRITNENRIKHRSLVKQQSDLTLSQASREEFSLLQLSIKVGNVEESVAAATVEYTDLLIAAENKDPAAEVKLPTARMALNHLKLKCAELSSSYKVMQAQCEANDQRRKDPGAMLPEVRVKATTAGEAKAFYIVAVLKKIVYMRSTGLRYLADYSPAQTKIYEALEKEEQNRKKEARAAFVLVDGMRKEHDAQIVRLVEEDDLKQRKNKDFFVPAESELQEERLEDEKMAIEERKKRRQFLSDKVLFDAPKRPRPVIVAFARDVPHYSKLRIHKEVTARLPGLFTVLDIEKNMGIHMHSIQTVLDAGKSVIMSVDHGLTKLTRTNFLKNLEMTLRGLIPVPYVVLIVGDETNKRLPGGSESFGVVNTDLDCMRDKDIKIALETMVYALDQLTVHSDYMSAISEEIMPPSPSYIVVIEAIYVIHSNVRTVRKPDDNMTAVSWRSLRLLLANPEEFVSHMRGIKRGSADIFMVELIDAYKKHKLWPPVTGQERKVDPVLHSLAFFVEHWAISERETINKNGIPSQLLYKSSVKGIHTVVTVTDGVDPEDNVLSESGGGGWRVPAAQVIRGALRDLRVSKNVQKIDNVLYNLSVYREDSMIYFDAYDPATSLVFLESVQVSDVPNLLRPNGHGIAKGVDVHPPVTPREMYVRLCKLLRFEKVSKYKNARQRLLCRREYTFMKNANCKIDGFRTFLTCFEGALGELYFSAYIPEYSATLTCLVDEHVRARLLINADPEFEKKTAEVEDATGALPYVMDRLRIAPSKTMYQVREISNSLDEQHDPRVATGMDRTMGLALRCRCVGGAGKLLLRRVVLFCKVPHILVLKSSSFTKTLLIYLYEPRTSYHMKIRLCPFFREMLFGSLTDDVNVFYKKLNKRLVFSWRGKHSITFDTTIYRSVRKIQKRLLVLTIALVDEQSVLMSLMDNGISTNFFTNVSKEQLIKILHFTPTVEAIKKTFKAGKVVESDAHVGGILSEVKSSSTFKDSSGVISGDSNSGVEAQTASLHFIEPKLFDVSLQTILSDPANLQTIGKKIEHIVRPMDPNSRLAGYMADEPTNLVFLSLSPSLEGDGKEPELLLDTTLRHSDWLKHGPRVNSVEGVVASRRQVPVVIMEEALNELAQAKADAAAKVAAENARVAAELFVTTKEIEPEEMVEAVQHASNLISDTIVETLEIKEINREAERRHPGLTQDMRHAMLYGPDGRTEHKIPIEEFTEVQRDILVAGEKLIFERGCRTNYREGKARWHGHVSVKVYEGVCWMGEDGVGKTYRFIVYESNVGKYFEGFVRSTRHLREILGIHAQDLLEKKKATEMLMFVIKYRMDLVKNNVNWDGTELEELDDDAPEYRVEFQMDRLYSEDKITPINAAGNADNDANAAKLIDMGMMFFFVCWLYRVLYT